MTWTYAGAPTLSVTDEVHFLVGDTDPTEQLVQDEEITYYIGLYPKPAGKPAYLAAAAVADAIAAQFARRADRTIGSLSISAKQQRDHYVELAQTLRTQFLTDGEGPAVDGGGGRRIVAAIPVLGGGGPTIL